MVGMKGGSVGIFELDTLVDDPRVVDADLEFRNVCSHNGSLKF